MLDEEGCRVESGVSLLLKPMVEVNGSHLLRGFKDSVGLAEEGDEREGVHTVAVLVGEGVASVVGWPRFGKLVDPNEGKVPVMRGTSEDVLNGEGAILAASWRAVFDASFIRRFDNGAYLRSSRSSTAGASTDAFGDEA